MNVTLGTWLIVVPAIAAVAVIMGTWFGGGASPGQRVGPVGWDFNESWASNLTVVIVLFEVLFVGDLLPAQGSLVSEGGYSNLAILYAALVIVAPFLYVAVSSEVIDAETGTAQRQGHVWSFAVSACLVLWAVLGQTTAAFVLSLDLLEGDVHQGVAWILIVLTGLVVLLALIHGAKSARFIFAKRTSGNDYLLPSFNAAAAPRWTMP